MPRYRRKSGTRKFFGFLTFVGFVVFAVAGVMVLRNVINGNGVVLVVSNASGETPNTIPLDALDVERRSPRAIQIGDLRLESPVRSVGLEEDGQLEVPDETEVGWYEYGSAPGLPGSTVLAGHVSWNRTVGPFHQLAGQVLRRDLPGQRLTRNRLHHRRLRLHRRHRRINRVGHLSVLSTRPPARLL